MEAARDRAGGSRAWRVDGVGWMEGWMEAVGVDGGGWRDWMEGWMEARLDGGCWTERSGWAGGTEGA